MKGTVTSLTPPAPVEPLTRLVTLELTDKEYIFLRALFGSGLVNKTESQGWLRSSLAPGASELTNAQIRDFNYSAFNALAYPR